MRFDENEYVESDATALASAVVQARVDPAVLLTMAIDRAHRLQPSFGAFSQFGEDLAWTQLQGPASTGPFAGVPFAVKDLGAPMAGLPTRAGSRSLARGVPPDARDGALIARLREGGFVPFGKTTVPEFGLNLSSEPMVGPVCRNPWAPAFGAGGSSGGAAAAVAAGIVPVAHATDAGGSIRIPAAACGVLGLKPGRGAVPRGPDYGNVFGDMAAEFVVTRSVRDSIAVWQWVTREAPSFERVAPLRIGLLLEAPLGSRMEAAWVDAASTAAAALRAAGHTVTPIDGQRLKPACTDAALAFMTYACRSSASAVESLNPAADDLEPITWAAARRGMTFTATNYMAAEIAVARSTDLMADFFGEVDVLLTPALACSLPEIGVLRTDGDDLDQHLARFDRYAPFAAVANASGCPAISVPHGSDAAGRPLAIQMMGRVGSETRLLGLAAWFEAHFPWRPVAP
ncbi:amidase [Variovorax ginsengisoli]|uniref:Amidase n=1 Tax=Variovorax ginsengisoli TaxID=363844 RepID=A0ABT9SD75_9BURK|nr:amidase [Variovorax ginsengisoli]MDP9901849.1 amidase [Variovorax ginsengisoli]